MRCAGEPDSGEPHTRPPALPPTPLCFSSSCLCADLVRLVSSSSSPTKCAAEQNGSLLHSHPQLPHNHRRPPLNVASQPGRQAGIQCASVESSSSVLLSGKPIDLPNPTKPNDDYYDDDERPSPPPTNQPTDRPMMTTTTKTTTKKSRAVAVCQVAR